MQKTKSLSGQYHCYKYVYVRDVTLLLLGYKKTKQTRFICFCIFLPVYWKHTHLRKWHFACPSSVEYAIHAPPQSTPEYTVYFTMQRTFSVTQGSMKRQMVNRIVHLCVSGSLCEGQGIAKVCAMNLWQITINVFKMCLMTYVARKKFLYYEVKQESVWQGQDLSVCECMCVSLVWNNIASPGIYFVEHKRIKAVTHVTAAAVKTGLLALPWLFLMMNYNNTIV